MAIIKFKEPLSRRWNSLNGWDYDDMKEWLQAALRRIDKDALIRHAESIKGQKLTMSQSFQLKDQFWIRFQMAAEDQSLVIAKVRLPRHPDTPATVTGEGEAYAIAYGVATMKFVKQRLSTVFLFQVSVYTKA